MRIKKVQTWLENQPFEVLLIDNPIDLYYLTGLKVSLGRLWITSKNAYFLLDGRYLSIGKEQAPCEVLSKESTLLPSLLQGEKQIAIDALFTSVEAYESLQKELPISFLKLAAPLKALKMVKEESEIALLKKAAKLTYKGYLEIRKTLKPGMREDEAALAFEIFCRKNGASRLSFDPIVAFGENSAYPHHHSSSKQWDGKEPVLLDLGAVVEEYAGDMTRVFCQNPDPKFAEIFEAVVEAQKRALATAKPGIPFSALDDAARAFLQEKQLAHYFTHGLGHGIGLETHEAPRISPQRGDRELLIEENMVFTVEPGVYIPGLGGVRYEDTIRITKTGVENFFPDDSTL